MMTSAQTKPLGLFAGDEMESAIVHEDKMLLDREVANSDSASTDSMELDDSFVAVSTRDDDAVLNLTRDEIEDDELSEHPFDKVAAESFCMPPRSSPGLLVQQEQQQSNDIVLQLIPSGVQIGCARLIVNQLPTLQLVLRKIETEAEYHHRLSLSTTRFGKKPLYCIQQRPEDVGEEHLFGELLRLLTEDLVSQWSRRRRRSRSSSSTLFAQQRLDRLSPFVENGKILTLLDMATYYGYRQLAIDIRSRLACEITCDSNWENVLTIVRCFSEHGQRCVDGDFVNKDERACVQHPVMGALIHRLRLLDEEELSKLVETHGSLLRTLPSQLHFLLVAFSGSSSSSSSQRVASTHAKHCRKSQHFASLALQRAAQLASAPHPLESNDAALCLLHRQSQGDLHGFIQRVKSLWIDAAASSHTDTRLRAHHPHAALRRTHSAESPKRQSPDAIAILLRSRAQSQPPLPIRPIAAASVAFPTATGGLMNLVIALDTCFELKPVQEAFALTYTSSLALARPLLHWSSPSAAAPGISFFLRCSKSKEPGSSSSWCYELGAQWQLAGSPCRLRNLRLKYSYQRADRPDMIVHAECAQPVDACIALNGRDPLIVLTLDVRHAGGNRAVSSSSCQPPVLKMPLFLVADLFC
jgi:hypothetical protein